MPESPFALPPAMLRDLERIVRQKIEAEQDGTSASFDKLVAQIASAVERMSSERSDAEDERRRARYNQLLLAAYLELTKSSPRFVRYEERKRESESHVRAAWELGSFQVGALQGVRECVHWRGTPLFKTVFELAIYPMLLWEVKPPTVIEIGSGLGASALWFADQLAALDVSATVLSLDRKKPAVQHPRVAFIEGDCFQIERDLPLEMLASRAHPWIVLEDAHANVEGVLRHLYRALVPGDYLVVEDSGKKAEAIEAFLDATADDLLVDTRYTDFFGRNTVSSADSLFVKQ